MKRIIKHLSRPLILSLALCFFMSCSGSSEKAPASVSKEETAAPNPSPGPEPATVANKDTAVAETDTAETPQPPTRETEEVAPLETPEAKPVVPTTATGGLAARTVSDNKLTTMLETIARELEAKKLAYVSSLGQDCSGIFHQIKDSIQVRMPTLADQSKYTYPTFRDDRNSRQIADWYYRNGNLHIVQDAMADRNLIRPGTVVFFGRTDEHYSNIGIDLLTNPGKFVHDGTKGKIYHVAVVTSVEKDDAGNVIKYTIMHGRNTKYPASRSSGNYDGPGGYGKAFAKFPFGNWNQQWVAMAHIETPAN